MLTLRFWPTVAVLVVAAVTVRLGFWQLSRAHLKEARAAQHALYVGLQPARITAVLQAPNTLTAKPVRVRGHFVPEHAVYLDNRPYQSAAGFYVIMPLRIDAPPASIVKKAAQATPSWHSTQPTYVLINRGWLPRNFRERTRLAPYQTPTTAVDIEGIALTHPGKLFTFQNSASKNARPKGPDIRQNIDPAAYQLETGLTMQPFIIEQHNALNDHLIRDWPKPTEGVERHYGYMVQWWGLTVAVLGFGLYCALRPSSREKKPMHANRKHK